MIQVEHLNHSYTARGGAVTALQDISFSVPHGEFLSIVGPSGCGKSTLIKIIGDIIEPQSGVVMIDDMPARQARLAGKFSFVFQNPVLLPWRRVIDNVRLPLEILGRKGHDPSELLKTVGLDGFGERYPWELSGGMRQRAVLARGLVFDPRVLLMDEPFASVDEITRQMLNLELLRIWRETGVTLLFITHSLAEAAYLSDRVLVLSKRPARVKEIVPIPFPRPRPESLQQTEPFLEVVRCLKTSLE